MIFQQATRSVTITTSMERSVLPQSELSVQSNFVPSLQDLSSMSTMGSTKFPTSSTDGSFGIMPTRNKFSGLLRRLGGRLRHAITIEPVEVDLPAALFPRGLNQSIDRLQSSRSSFRFSPSQKGAPSGPANSLTLVPSLMSHMSSVSLKRLPRSSIASIPGRLRRDALKASKSWIINGLIGTRTIRRSPLPSRSMSLDILVPHGFAFGYCFQSQLTGSVLPSSTR